MKNSRLFNSIAIILLFTISNCSKEENGASFVSSFPQSLTRTWIGPDYWANPLQDWQLNNGRMECIVSGGDRNVVLLTREINRNDGSFELSVEFGTLDKDIVLDESGWIGFKIGIRGEFSDYRDSAVRGEGFPVGITSGGRLFIGRVDNSISPVHSSLECAKLRLSGTVKGSFVNLKLELLDKDGILISEQIRDSVDADWIAGMIAVVCHSGELPGSENGRRVAEYHDWGTKPGTNRQGNIQFWFNNLSLSGNLVNSFPHHSFGPLLFSQYTLSDSILKLTVQLPPVSEEDGKEVLFQKKVNGEWKTISQTLIDTISRTAAFRLEDWESDMDVPYRLVYEFKAASDKSELFYREGIIKKEPLDKEELVVAAFTGNNDLGFPNNELVDAVKFHNPDILFFSGDQIYEGVGGYGIQTDNLEKITLDYLRKWYLFGWAYGELMRDTPTVSIPDDHDVYHGNIWGAGGKATPKGLRGAEAQDEGGYKYFPEWVNAVQRTQTSHLPDAYDPRPVEQNIGVYFTDMNYAGISFAIIEDRKFKSAPKVLLPEAKVFNGWAQNKSFDATSQGDIEGAVLLGQRQLEFLNDWAGDWSDNIWMKVLLSQTIFANVATLPKENSHSDNIVPKLEIFKTGEYPPDDIPVQDMDSNGWPQSPRNRALETIRKAFAFHIAGDQHLGSTIQYGVDDWHDAGFAFCVPAISNVWPRRWFPAEEGKNRRSDMPAYTGDFKEGFGNYISVYAVSNPFISGKKPSKLYDRATGFGIVRFNKKSRDITIECWPRWVDPWKKEGEQYPGWPITINQMDNYGRAPEAFLPDLIVKNISNPVVQIINQDNGEVVYTLRLNGDTFRPFVFIDGQYIIKIGEPGTNKFKILRDVASSPNNKNTLEINF